ncbi:MAG: OB-fold nucleic acid binding domain-containing protein [Nanoarchaeota archaeon]
MISMPLPEIIAKIKEATSLTDEDIKQKIRQKLDTLSGLISEEGAAHIIANELGVKLIQLSGPLQVKNVLAGMRNVEVSGKVLRKYELREFAKDGREGKVASFIMADETGVIRIVLWNEQADVFDKLKEGDIVKILSGYVRENNGRKEIQLNQNSKLILNPKDVTINIIDRESVRKQISALAETDTDVDVLATIVQVFDLRFFEVCPECQKRMTRKDETLVCPQHGKVSPDFSYVLNLFLDDGTGTIRTVLWKRQAQRLLDLPDEEVKQFRTSPELFEKHKTDLLGSFVKISGRINKNPNFDSIELVANLVFPHPDPEEELRALQQKEKEPGQAINAEKEAPKTDQGKAVSDDDSYAALMAAVKEADKGKKKDENAEDIVSIDELEDFED